MQKLAFLIAGALLFGGCAGAPPANLGVEDGHLAPCPDKPNCVNSQSPDEKHYVAPLSYEGTKQEALKRLRQIIQVMPRAEITAEKTDYLRAEFTSRIMRFVDDVEFFFPDEPVVHVRSAARVGYSDFGVNRKRIEAIRDRFRSGVCKP
ncbi:MAG: DUF1499 domain-containing protein [Thermodesulfobacteriota bacterium]|nr:DUF1499 domain-containing protein [Thermodesulfobacteriota bacterium]